jgi:ABC-type bacteriocin/lantibiotic exporter with double-glycine peptidase domain
VKLAQKVLQKFQRTPFGLLKAFALFFILGACSSTDKVVSVHVDEGIGNCRIVKNVPFYAQEDYQCGPSSLAGVLNYYGQNILPQQIANEIFDEKVRGTLSTDMVFFARELGFDVQWFKGDAEDITRNINQNQPLIAMVDLGVGPVKRPHYLVVVGYGKKQVIVNSGARQHKAVSWSRFLKQWDRAHRWTLQIYPKKVP